MARKRLTKGQKVVGGVIAGVLIYSTVQYLKNRSGRSNLPQNGSTPSGSGGSGYVSPMNYAGGTAGSVPGGNWAGSTTAWITSGNTGSNVGSLPRGLKNNNPLNIIITSDKWQGKIPVAQNTDGKFEQFQNILYGYRASIRTLKSYFNTGRDTIAEITQRWAPAGSGEGNNPQNYALRVSNGTGIGVNAQLPFTPEVIVPIVREMAVVENGEAFRNKISDNDIMKAWQLI
jgi:hypothetical protein